jgi:regulatory protein YycH of two-component signal transduction system YycFG
MKYVHGQKQRQSYTSLVIIWSLVVISGVLAWLTFTGQLFALSVNKTSPAVIVGEQYNPQQTISGEVLQPAGTIEIKTYNPQQTINGKELQRQADLSSVGN